MYRPLFSRKQPASIEEDLYSKKFHPYCCCHCKKLCLENFCRCKCNMVVYCSEEHKLKDHTYHVDICIQIQQFSVEEDFKYFWEPCSTKEEWIISRKVFIDCIQKRLQRPLRPYEQQIIKFANSCLICRKQNEDLDYCPQCYSVNYCKEHFDAGVEKHKKKCYDLKMCYRSLAHECRPTFMRTFSNFTNVNNLVNMSRFLMEYVSISGSFLDVWLFTDYLSGPLTLCYWMNTLHLLKPKSQDFCVHIIDANSIDTENIKAWELLLHSLNISELRVELIGWQVPNKTGTFELCTCCRARNKTFTYSSYCGTYLEYISKFKEITKQPSIIMAFGTDFCTWNTLSLNVLKRSKCPMIITNHSTDHLNKQLKIIDPELMYETAKKNPFNSLMPHREFETDGVYFRNEYVVIIKDFAEKAIHLQIQKMEI